MPHEVPPTPCASSVAFSWDPPRLTTDFLGLTDSSPLVLPTLSVTLCFSVRICVFLAIDVFYASNER